MKLCVQVRRPDGSFQGNTLLRYCFEAMHDTTRSDGIFRLRMDALFWGLATLHMLWLAQNCLALTARQRRQGVRSVRLHAPIYL